MEQAGFQLSLETVLERFVTWLNGIYKESVSRGVWKVKRRFQTKNRETFFEIIWRFTKLFATWYLTKLIDLIFIMVFFKLFTNFFLNHHKFTTLHRFYSSIFPPHHPHYLSKSKVFLRFQIDFPFGFRINHRSCRISWWWRSLLTIVSELFFFIATSILRVRHFHFFLIWFFNYLPNNEYLKLFKHLI